MKPSPLLPLAVLNLALASAASAVTYSTDAIATAPPGTQVYYYRENPPGQIVLDNTYPVLSALQGTAGASGGNVELFATGDLQPNFQNQASGGAFATVPLVTLSGTANSIPFTLSSLNGTVWFSTSGGYDTAWGAANLANVWFNQLIDSIVAKTTDPLAILGIQSNRQNLYNSFLAQGGFTELSDPNISYLYEDGGVINFGLAGFLDQSPRLRAYYPAFANLIPNGIQWSEVVLVNNVPTYSFSGTPSGVSAVDNSFNATFAFTAVPEPSAALLALPVLLLGLRRRR